jgi:4-diphosphocytidyl-2-C-methyl-D-erythritol kinase
MKIRAYAKATLVLQVHKKNKNEPKHKINAIFALYKKIYDEIYIKQTTIGKDVINYYVNNKHTNFCDCRVQQILNLLREKFPIPFYSIKIHKHIPIGSGLGGSATDAGHVAKYILKTLNINISKINMQQIALEVGSDIPFFIYDYNYAQVSNFGDCVKPIKNKS